MSTSEHKRAVTAAAAVVPRAERVAVLAEDANHDIVERIRQAPAHHLRRQPLLVPAELLAQILPLHEQRLVQYTRVQIRV